jgi:hypothetical protein
MTTTNKMTTTTLPVFKKGATRYAITPEGKALPLIWRSKNSGAYHNSKRSLPESLPYGHYLGKPSKVDQTEIDFVEARTFETKEGWTRLV